MIRTPQLSLDEETLAALLSGSLAERERTEVLARLAQDPEARLVLQMAIEALETAESAGPARQERVEPGRRAA